MTQRADQQTPKQPSAQNKTHAIHSQGGRRGGRAVLGCARAVMIRGPTPIFGSRFPVHVRVEEQPSMNVTWALRDPCLFQTYRILRCVLVENGPSQNSIRSNLVHDRNPRRPTSQSCPPSSSSHIVPRPVFLARIQSVDIRILLEDFGV